MNNATSTANASLGYLSSEAISLIDQAKRYRAMMEALPAGDSRREVYENIIRELLERSRRLSTVIVTSTSSTT